MRDTTHICARCLRNLAKRSQSRWQPLLQPRHASTAAAITPAPPIDQTIISPPPTARYPPNQPPSHRPPEFRKSQLHRQYTSLLRSTPLMLLFHHNNLKANEWMAVRRELAQALQSHDAQVAKSNEGENENNNQTPLSQSIKIQIIQSHIFSAALRVVEYWDPNPKSLRQPPSSTPSDPSTQSSTSNIQNTTPTPKSPALTHALSRKAHSAVLSKKYSHPLTPLLSGPVAILTFPTVSPGYLKTAISILAPHAPDFPAPTRRGNPGYHDPITQAGLQKLMLLGASVEGRVFDVDGVKGVAGIEGGLEGLRGKLVGMLQGVGVGLTGALEGAGRNLYLTVEGRRVMLEKEAKGGEGGGT